MFSDLIYSLSPLTAWLAFAACLLVILVSGVRLSRYADLIAAHTGLGGAWIGLVLLATVTSLPELVTGLSAIWVVNAPDLAVGSALGSCIYNLIIIAILDMVYQPGTIYSGIKHGHSLSAGFGVVLLGAAASAIFVQHRLVPVSIGPVGPYALAAPLIYFIAMRSVFFFERRDDVVKIEGLMDSDERSVDPIRTSLGRVFVFFALNAAALVAAAVVLPIVGQAIAIGMGWEQTFVGTIFLAFVTSVPEIVVSVEAVRIGAVDLAIGGILGSNLFNMLIIAIEDLAYVKGPILADAGVEHVLSAIAAVTMTGIAMVGLSSRPKARVFRRIGWSSLGLLAVGVFSALVLFLLGQSSLQ